MREAAATRRDEWKYITYEVHGLEVPKDTTALEELAKEIGAALRTTMEEEKRKSCGSAAKLAEEIAADLKPKRASGKGGSAANPTITVTPVAPSGGPPKADPTATAKRSKSQAKLENTRRGH